MRMYILNSPSRDIVHLVEMLERNNHQVLVQSSVWNERMSDTECSRILRDEYDLTFTELQIGWRQVKNAEWSTALGHHKIYLRALADLTESDEWVCIMEDDIELFPDFFERISELEAIKFNGPTVIQLFTRGKRFCHVDKLYSRLHSTLYRADYPPGQTCLYLMNRKAIEMSTTRTRATGDADWPLWGMQCNFILSYPWVAIEFPLNTLLPIYERSRLAYYLWRIRVLIQIDYLSWRIKGYTYSQYFFFMIRPWLLRVLYKFNFYRDKDNSDPNSIWIRIF